MTLDPRLNPFRADLAAEHLRGRVEAGRFVTGSRREVVVPVAPVRRKGGPDAMLDTEALMGERFVVYETTPDGWCWGQLEADGYVGFVPADTLGVQGADATHVVRAPRTLAFSAPSIKAPPVAGLPCGAQLAIVGEKGRFAITAGGAFVPFSHLAERGTAESDFVAVAERFLGVPYLWGGKTSLGIDCSGLSQIALTACGVPCPRDSDMQERGLGRAVDPAAGLQRGDLVFWKGHIGIMRDAETLLHANAFHIAVALEPLAGAIARIRPTDGDPTSFRRLQV